jgi:hypothetical protein
MRARSTRESRASHDIESIWGGRRENDKTPRAGGTNGAAIAAFRPHHIRQIHTRLTA